MMVYKYNQFNAQPTDYIIFTSDTLRDWLKKGQYVCKTLMCNHQLNYSRSTCTTTCPTKHTVQACARKRTMEMRDRTQKNKERSHGSYSLCPRRAICYLFNISITVSCQIFLMDEGAHSTNKHHTCIGKVKPQWASVRPFKMNTSAHTPPWHYCHHYCVYTMHLYCYELPVSREEHPWL